MTWLANNYFERALVAVVLVGALAGAIGVHVVLRRLAFFSQAMTHATFPGVVLAALLGMNLYVGAGLFGILAVVAVAWLANRPKADVSSVVGVALSAGFAGGVVLLSAQSGFSKDLSAYLVGSVLTVQVSDLIAMGVVTLSVLLILALLRKEFFLAAFDRGTLAAQGYPVIVLDIALLLLIEAVIVVAVPVVGTVLCVALLVAPAATARLWTDSQRAMTSLAIGIGVFSGFAGLLLSYWLDIAAGAAIAMVATSAFAGSLLVSPRHGLLRRMRVSHVIADSR